MAADQGAIVPDGNVADTAEGTSAHVADPGGGNKLTAETNSIVFVIRMVDHCQADGREVWSWEFDQFGPDDGDRSQAEKSAMEYLESWNDSYIEIITKPRC